MSHFIVWCDAVVDDMASFLRAIIYEISISFKYIIVFFIESPE